MALDALALIALASFLALIGAWLALPASRTNPRPASTRLSEQPAD